MFSISFKNLPDTIVFLKMYLTILLEYPSVLSDVADKLFATLLETYYVSAIFSSDIARMF